MMERRLSEIEEGLGRELQALLSGTIFSGYTDRAKFRSDDLGVRNSASQDVLRAKTYVEEAVSRWTAANVAEPTRESPFPPAEVTRTLQSLRAFVRELGDLESAIRGAEAPDYDSVWNPKRDGVAVLTALLEADRALLTHCRALEQRALDLAQSDLSKEEAFGELRGHMAQIRSALRQRRELL